jgi:hypothetical protein
MRPLGGHCLAGPLFDPVAAARPGFFVAAAFPRKGKRKTPPNADLAILSAKQKGLKSAIENLHVGFARGFD